VVRRVLLAGVLVAVAGLAACKSPAQSGCEAQGGSWDPAGWPACDGRDWSDSVYERETCIMVVMAQAGASRGVASKECI
jgi:hypothetical protein